MFDASEEVARTMLGKHALTQEYPFLVRTYGSLRNNTALSWSEVAQSVSVVTTQLLGTVQPSHPWHLFLAYPHQPVFLCSHLHIVEQVT